MRKVLYVGVVMLILVVVGLQFILPDLLNQKVIERMNKVFNPTTSTVEITSIPAVKLLIGQVDEINADIQEAKLKDGFVFKEIRLHVTGVGFDLASMYGAQDFKPNSVDSGRLEGILTEKDVSNYLSKKMDKLEEATIHFRANEVTLEGRVSIGGFLEGMITATGTVEIKGNTVIFSPHKMALNSMNLNVITSAILREVPIYNFDEFPFPVKAKEVEAQNGTLRVVVVPVAK